MCPISNRNRPDSISETSGEDGDIADSFTGKNDKSIIKQADSVLITRIFDHYGLHLSANNRKAICPFPAHKGGRERTASFWYYPETNTYCCFGCRAGCAGSDFVSNMDRISKMAAAYKILNIFGSGSINEQEQEIERVDFSERLEIMLDFSNAVREFRQANLDEKSVDFIEHICWVYDTVNVKRKDKLDNEALRNVVQKLKEKIKSYTPCLML